ncbi:N-formylglutamate amidohydrolase [Caulobacter mirabilis]|uniref:N-formylglutamate amidohydrolase n=1 Tax=Caulobacter mirabilis TaxID=69666 RepID=A0A2D2B3R1_9CAUL|nr:N-formylglutamate amidohydrolase [Caulobacter mirabilis]ATQ44844.1 N-formylglutamate amidohydrolase [Caulobacter mirabilis]
MNAWQPLPESGATTAETPAFEVIAADPPPTPLVFASPHSGRLYPPAMLEASAVLPEVLRRSEDAFVDAMVTPAAELGAAVILARYGRAWMDLNREPWELDPTMFSDELPDFARGRTARVAAGLGAIARVAGEGREIYARKLTFAEAQARVDGTHRPYHDALDRLLARARATHGMAVLIDWHSMPEAAARTAVTPRHGKGCDMVLGDRFGASCTRKLTDLVERELEGMGYRVARNAPYAGGYTTEHYGKPQQKTHALQIEINRALYLDEATLEPTAGLAKLTADVGRLARILAADWPRLAPA